MRGSRQTRLIWIRMNAIDDVLLALLRIFLFLFSRFFFLVGSSSPLQRYELLVMSPGNHLSSACQPYVVLTPLMTQMLTRLNGRSM